jgi:hypothetical protein
VAALAVAEPIGAVAVLPPERRSASERTKLRSCFLERHAPEPMRQAHKMVLELHRERERLIDSFPTTMVMVEMDPPRTTHLLIRGSYDRPGEQVGPGTPAVLSPLPPGGHNDRLRLARWLVDPANPLTARVAVNRFWLECFGTGIVKTVDDFGLQGDPPSHPELLDWLATEFVRQGWDVKALHRLIVTSAAYRQSSHVSQALAQRDPENRLLAHGPRYRLPAETIRDQALAASGLLVEHPGGPSVKPYQPAGLWGELTGGEEYKQDHGANLYRRSLYTFWKRTVAPPAMINFDASGREFCVVRETRTNTPLQALNLMNDVTFVEAARVLAQRVLKQGPAGTDERLARAFRRVLARTPSAAELAVLRASLHEHLERYRKAPDAAVKLVSVGESPRDERLDAGELAAYTAVAGMILNLDEAITKE